MEEQYAIRIAVLDDDAIALKLFARMLENLGYTSITTWDNGRDALEQVDKPGASPDLIILDLKMPGMDGLEFIRHLGERRYKGSVIVVSGEGEPLLLAAGKLLQAHNIPLLGHLHKPVVPENLAALIERWKPPQDESQAVKKIYSADEVRAAIANGELVNYYQPKIAVANGRVVGVEALVRWQHPVDGVLLPEQFIGVAEAHGLIGDLDQMVLTNALAQVKRWQDEGIIFSVSVNVPANNFASPDFADVVEKIAAKAGMSPQMVVLEVSERLLMQEDQRALIENMARLHLKRFRLSIDDYGMRNVPMKQLRGLPFDELKICKRDVHAAWVDEQIREAYAACLTMARKLRMEVVAVGVEDMDDWEYVHRKWIECDYAQGYFIASPMPAADFPGWKTDWQKRWSSGFKEEIQEFL